MTKDVPSTEIIIMDSPDELLQPIVWKSFEVTPGMSGNYSSGMTNWGGKKIDGSKMVASSVSFPKTDSKDNS